MDAKVRFCAGNNIYQSMMKKELQKQQQLKAVGIKSR